jgi:hypothetical protein
MHEKKLLSDNTIFWLIVSLFYPTCDSGWGNRTSGITSVGFLIVFASVCVCGRVIAALAHQRTDFSHHHRPASPRLIFTSR